MKQYSTIVSIIIALLFIACDDNIDDREFSQFKHPESIALVCASPDEGPLPLDKCTNSSKSDARIFGLVTQTEYGEVAVTDLEDRKLIDQEDRIPFNSYIPVGGHPSDIVVTADGKTAYTVNSETLDISVIDVARAVEGAHFDAAASIYIGAAGDSLVAFEDVTYQHTFLAVTLPDSGQLAIVNPEPLSTSLNDGTEITIPVGPIAYLRLDATTANPDVTEDPRKGGIAPMALLLSETYASLYVAGSAGDLDADTPNGSYVAEIHRGALIDHAIQSYLSIQGPSPLNAAGVVIRRMDLNSFTVADMAVEPELERWIYFVENEKKGVAVLDLLHGELVEVNAHVDAESPYSIEVPGIARKVAMKRFSETIFDDEKPGPYDFNGTYAVVSTTEAQIFVIDVEVNPAITDKLEDFSVYPHALHFAYEMYEEEDDSYSILYPMAYDIPSLRADDDTLVTNESPFASMVEGHAGESCSDTPSGYRYIDDDNESNLYLSCDRRNAPNDGWQIVYEGQLGISGVGVINPDSSESEVVFTDESKDFCLSGVLGPISDDIFGYFPEEGEAGGFQALRNYSGDTIEITSEPTPVNNVTNCKMYTDDDVELRYRISRVLGSDTLAIHRIGTNGPPVPTKECFGQAFTYIIRATNSWVLSGEDTGYFAQRGHFAQGACLPWTAADDDDPSQVAFESSRVFSGEVYSNRHMTFKFIPDEIIPDEVREDYDLVGFTFATKYGFSPLSAYINSDVTDMVFAPNNELVLIEKSEGSAYIFDFLDEFELSSKQIN